ncbi:MAG: 5'/3'-nucleotidase SurE [Candidatus Micrarchaeia archaeon]
MRILVTNDDGDSEGLRMLLEVAGRFGTAYAITPNRQRSAVSGALTLHKPIRLHHISDELYSINGTPSDCVLFGLHSGEFGKPDLVLSGINWGDNTGLGSLIGSGTVGACWQAALEGVPSIAFSMSRGSGDWRVKESWGDRDLIVKKVAEIVKKLRPKLGRDRFFNVNMPTAQSLEGAKVVHVRKMQRERYDVSIVMRHDPDGRPYYWISGPAHPVEKGTDVHEVVVSRNIAVSEVSLSIFDR